MELVSLKLTSLLLLILRTNYLPQRLKLIVGCFALIIAQPRILRVFQRSPELPSLLEYNSFAIVRCIESLSVVDVPNRVPLVNILKLPTPTRIDI